MALSRALMLLMLTAAPAFAGKTGAGGIGGLPVFVPPSVFDSQPTRGAAGAELSLAAVPEAIAAATAACAASGGYAVDCLADRLAQIAAAMPPTEAASAIIAAAARDMAALAAANRDATRPTAHLRQAGQRITSRPLTPVAPSQEAQTRAQAAAIMERAELTLLRSDTNSAERRRQYQRIAVAVGSTKVLLRSS